MMLSAKIKDKIFPSKCIFCKKIITDTENAVCDECSIELENKKPKQSLYSLEGTEGITFPFFYSGMVKKAMLGYKFHGKKHYSDYFASQIVNSLYKCDCEFDLITYVPIGFIRYMERGYNQSYLLARYISKQMNIPCCKTLKKSAFIKRQSARTFAERRLNVKKAFKKLNKINVEGKNILIIDDICTTGSTLTNIAELLNLHGADKIYCACVARVR